MSGDDAAAGDAAVGRGDAGSRLTFARLEGDREPSQVESLGFGRRVYGALMAVFLPAVFLPRRLDATHGYGTPRRPSPCFCRPCFWRPRDPRACPKPVREARVRWETSSRCSGKLDDVLGLFQFENARQIRRARRANRARAGCARRRGHARKGASGGRRRGKGGRRLAGGAGGQGHRLAVALQDWGRRRRGAEDAGDAAAQRFLAASGSTYPRITFVSTQVSFPAFCFDPSLISGLLFRPKSHFRPFVSIVALWRRRGARLKVLSTGPARRPFWV
ncbi:hypothetical protein M885DRAFT_342111 [Pelagophyceae sp. CCMP2097]|nr:hypothetical protein M885DRAFT_342111 [Pelagophyceae sp. CCMP2097]